MHFFEVELNINWKIGFNHVRKQAACCGYFDCSEFLHDCSVDCSARPVRPAPSVSGKYRDSGDGDSISHSLPLLRWALPYRGAQRWRRLRLHERSRGLHDRPLRRLSRKFTLYLRQLKQKTVSRTIYSYFSHLLSLKISWEENRTCSSSQGFSIFTIINGCPYWFNHVLQLCMHNCTMLLWLFLQTQ